MIKTKKNPIKFKDTLNVMNTLRVGKISNIHHYREILNV